MTRDAVPGTCLAPAIIRRVKHLSSSLATAAALAALVSAQQAPRPFDLLITNARIIDGTGAPAVTGSVGVRDGRFDDHEVSAFSEIFFDFA